LKVNRRFDIPSFPTALQLRVSFDLLNNLLTFFIFFPTEADYLVSEQFSFYGVRLLASQPTPNLEDQGIPLRLTCPAWMILPVATLPPA
jgi:hypothetical protein